MKHVIHVNQAIIKTNKKTGRRDPVLTVKTYKSNKYAHQVEIKGPCRVVYSPDKPLSCGAVCWIECGCEVVLTLQGQSSVVESLYEQRNRRKVAKKVGTRRSVQCGPEQQ